MARPGEKISNRATGETIIWIETAADSGGERLVMTFCVAPGGRLPVRHFHPRQTETFAVKTGELEVELAKGELRRIGPGEALTIAPGVVHSWRNPSAGTSVETTVTFTPALNTEEFLEQFFGLGNAGRTASDGTPRFLQIMTMVNRYQLYIDGPPLIAQKFLGAVVGGLARLLGYRAFDPSFSPDGPVRATRSAATRKSAHG